MVPAQRSLHARFLRETGAIDDYFSIFKGASFEIRFTRYQFQNGDMALTWRSSPGRRYRIEYASELKPSSWLAVSPELLATAGSMSWTHSPQSTRGFYRVREAE